MRTLIFKVSFLVTFLCTNEVCTYAQSNKIDYLASDVSYIQTYGLEDKTTLDFIQLLAADTNNLVFLEGYGNFFLKTLLENRGEFMSGELPHCDQQIEPLRNLMYKKNLMGFEDNHEIRFPAYYFKKTDSTKYDQITKYYGILNIKEDFRNFDAKKRIEVCNQFASAYSFSQLDSLLLLQKAFGKIPNTEDLKMIGINKKIIFLYSDYGIRNGIDDFISNYKGTNTYFILADKGSKTVTKFFYFNNHIKKKKSLEEFSLIPRNNLPRKIVLSKKDRFYTKELKEFNFIYVSELKNCAW